MTDHRQHFTHTRTLAIIEGESFAAVVWWPMAELVSLEPLIRELDSFDFPFSRAEAYGFEMVARGQGRMVIARTVDEAMRHASDLFAEPRHVQPELDLPVQELTAPAAPPLETRADWYG